jgi:hypothetical protein
MVPRGIKVDAATVADRVKSRKRLDEVQREIEDLTRQVDEAPTLLEKVTLRKKLAMKEEEREKLYDDTILNKDLNTVPVNLDAVEKAITLRERRARNKETQKLKTNMQKLLTRSPVRVKMPTLTLKNRMAINSARLRALNNQQIQNGFKRAIRFAEDLRTKEAREKAAENDAEAERLLKKMQTKWVNPELKKAQEEQSELETQQKLFFQIQKEDDSEMPSELLHMAVNAKKTRKSRPMPKIRKRL